MRDVLVIKYVGQILVNLGLYAAKGTNTRLKIFFLACCMYCGHVELY